MDVLPHIAEQPEQIARSISGYLLRPLAVLREVRRDDLRADAVAGVTVAAVAIPQSIAYAAIADLPPSVGLYTAGIAAVVGALWGSSRYLSTGPVNAVSLLMLPILLAVAAPGTPRYLLAAGVIAVIAGLMSICMAFLRLGSVVTLASRPVLIGFITGAALQIAVGQLHSLFGVDLPMTHHLYGTAAAVVRALPDLNPYSVSLGIGALLVMAGLRRAGDRAPAALTVIVLSGVAVSALRLGEHGVQVLSAVPRALPHPIWATTGALPDLGMIQALLMGSAAVAALGLVEASAMAQNLARGSGDRLDANQEFFGQGLANVASGLLSGFACAGSPVRSTLNRQSGARSQMAGVFTGGTVIAAVLLLGPYASRVPRAAVAGVLLVIAWGMVDWTSIKRTARASRSEAAIMAATFLATIVLSLDFAILAGVVFSLAMFIVRSSLPRVYPVVPDPTYRHFIQEPSLPVCPQLGIMNIRGPLFFGAVYHIEEELRHNHERHPGQRSLVLRMHGVDMCDVSGVEMLESTVKTYRERGGDVYLVRLRRPVFDLLDHSGFLDRSLGRDHVLDQEGAIEYLWEHDIDPNICIYECEHRVFAECQTVDKYPYAERVPPAPRHPRGHRLQVPPREFQRLMKDPQALLLDVREPSEHSRAHLPGARLVPLRKLIESPVDLPRDRTILLACRSGRRAARALYVLEELGYERLAGLRGGILAWRAAGLPVVLEDDSSPRGSPRN
jgi:SulP family sulfate permease